MGKPFDPENAELSVVVDLGDSLWSLWSLWRSGYKLLNPIVDPAYEHQTNQQWNRKLNGLSEQPRAVIRDNQSLKWTRKQTRNASSG